MFFCDHGAFSRTVEPTFGIVLKSALMLALLATADRAQAQSQDEPEGFSGSVGLGVASTPSYEGSENRRTLVGPDLSLVYRSEHWGRVELGQQGLVWQVLEKGDFRVSLIGNVDAGRKTSKPSVTDPTPGNEQLAGIGDLHASPEAGAGIGYGPVSLQARHSIGERGHQGTLVDLNVQWPVALTDRLGMSFGATATWADRKYMQAYFGVTPLQATATHFSAYTPDAGLRKAELNVGMEYELSSDWRLRGSVAVGRLGKEAGNSPLTIRDTGVTAGVAIVYVF